MELQVDRKSGVPLYLQLKTQIKALIDQGKWEPGKQLPTERELADALGLSRNTVSMAYKALESEGILHSHQGKGTFVAQSGYISATETQEEKLAGLIDVAIDEALGLGFSIDDFVRLALQRVKRKKEALRGIKVAFIECNREQLDYFAQELAQDAGVTIVPVLLHDLRENPAASRETFDKVDLIVTTYFHIDEVHRLIGEGKNVVGVALSPQMETVVRIARAAENKRLGMVCLTSNFVRKVKNSLSNAGIATETMLATTTKNEDELVNFIKQVDALIVSPNRKKDVMALVPAAEVIEFVYHLDVGSLKMLNAILLELKKER